ncbi:rhomboid family intramembrane serine protease [Bifidobacterium sp. MA2]|uniref:Rhomboid family intramembrane serine protease n=2 Tax=Bifidobacterium santillanense TaxID=2809028 RepID=A0ABS5UNZ7_9BIFI|nr:rhomboid family intramembrane serine protease [Bifidobacterium santillanense]MBT1172659.1 rhomboid family intramembrane serine protease [Bifidobacterium santillanense]
MNLPTKQQIAYEWKHNGPVVTKVLIAACVAVWAVEVLLRLISPGLFAMFVSSGMVMPLTMLARPWTWLTSMFLHAPNIMHILFNMIALWSVGPELERLMGHWRYLALYLISGFGGAVGLVVWARFTGDWMTATYGASGALFGLFAAILVVYRRIGADIRSMMIWMAVNFLLPFVVGGIAWQAHVGGFVTGGVLTWLLVAGLPALRGRSFNARMWIYGTAIVAVLLIVAIICTPLRML